MYYKVERRYNSLKLNDDFASLKNIWPDGTLDFEFSYIISQADVISKNATAVEVSVFTRTIKKRSIVESTIGKIDAQQLIDNVLTDTTSAKTAIQNQEIYVLKKRISDLTAQINNEVYGPLSNGVSPNEIGAMYGTFIKTIPAGQLQHGNDAQPVLETHDFKVDNISTAVSSSISENYKSLANELITRCGLDPSYVAEISDKSLSSERMVQGTLRPTVRNEETDSVLNRMYDYMVLHAGLITPQKTSNAIDSSKSMRIVVTEAIDEIEIPVRLWFKMPAENLNVDASSNVFVKFRLIDSNTNSSLDEITKILDITRHINIFRTPVSAPIMKYSRSDISSRVNLSITQTDYRANQISLYKKSLFASNVDIDQYTLVGTYNLLWKHNTIIQVDLPTYDTVIYRAIPSNYGLMGASFTNVVIKPKKFRSKNIVSVTSSIIENGILVEVTSIPTTTISMQVVQRNLTTIEQEFTAVNEPLLIDDVIRNVDHISVSTLNVQNFNVYEFGVILYHKDGTKELATTTDILEYVIPTPGKVDVVINNLNVSHLSNPNVTFSVDVNVLDSNIDSIKSLMEKQGIRTYFEDDITKQRNELKQLLAYSVHRINLTTGEREDMGVITSTTFNDEQMRKNYATKELQYGNKYRYVITALMRAPETVLDGLQKTTVDVVTKKQYTYSPSKFQHPLALTRGVIVSPAGLRTRYSKNTLEHGVLGMTSTVEVSFDIQQVKIVESSVTRFDRYTNIVAWHVEGDIRNIDQFIIAKEVHGIRSIVGVAHSEFLHGSCHWYHHLTRDDKGEFRYLIWPIQNNYENGTLSITNSIIVDD